MSPYRRPRTGAFFHVKYAPPPFEVRADDGEGVELLLRVVEGLCGDASSYYRFCGFAFHAPACRVDFWG